MEINNKIEAISYYITKAIQLLKHKYKLQNIDSSTYKNAVIATFYHENLPSKIFYSIYILNDFRGNGLYESIYQSLCDYYNSKITMITSKQCNIEAYLDYKKINYISLDLSFGFQEYELISQYYLDKRTNRSNIRLMNHIDEGLRILIDIGASEEAMKAYCIHPIIQTEEDLSVYDFSNISTYVMNLAFEYKKIANSYLSSRKIVDISEINLSKKNEVNDMLIADKIQNFKDFELYHSNTHSKSKNLYTYFDNWFRKLGILPELYINEKRLIKIL